MQHINIKTFSEGLGSWIRYFPLHVAIFPKASSCIVYYTPCHSVQLAIHFLSEIISVTICRSLEKHLELCICLLGTDFSSLYFKIVIFALKSMKWDALLSTAWYKLCNNLYIWLHVLPSSTPFSELGSGHYIIVSILP